MKIIITCKLVHHTGVISKFYLSTPPLPPTIEQNEKLFLTTLFCILKAQERF